MVPPCVVCFVGTANKRWRYSCDEGSVVFNDQQRLIKHRFCRRRLTDWMLNSDLCMHYQGHSSLPRLCLANLFTSCLRYTYQVYLYIVAYRSDSLLVAACVQRCRHPVCNQQARLAKVSVFCLKTSNEHHAELQKYTTYTTSKIDCSAFNFRDTCSLTDCFFWFSASYNRFECLRRWQ